MIYIVAAHISVIVKSCEPLRRLDCLPRVHLDFRIHTMMMWEYTKCCFLEIHDGPFTPDDLWMRLNRPLNELLPRIDKGGCSPHAAAMLITRGNVKEKTSLTERERDLTFLGIYCTIAPIQDILASENEYGDATIAGEQLDTRVVRICRISYAFTCASGPVRFRFKKKEKKKGDGWIIDGFDYAKCREVSRERTSR